MPKQDIIEKIKKAGLCGRSGSGFPTALKWELVKNPSAGSGQAPAKTKYVVCNASEGEPRVFKDRFILKNYPQDVINGIKIALETIGAKKAYIYINKRYHKRFGKTLRGLIGDSPIELFKKEAGYLRGEETTLLNVIERKPALPRLKPPFPTKVGLFGKPTLINNVETFYCVSKIAKGEYKKTKFYSIVGHVKNKGVFELPETLSIKEILKRTGNWPAPPAGGGSGEFFVQSGGGACGEVLLKNELSRPVKGLGAIIVYSKKKTDPLKLMKKWARFFNKENCDKCMPCREGLYRVAEMLYQDRLDEEMLNDIFTTMDQSSLCPLGRLAVVPFKSAIKKLL